MTRLLALALIAFTLSSCGMVAMTCLLDPGPVCRSF